MSKFLSISEAARALDLDPSRVRALAAHGQLPAIRIGRSWAIEPGAVDQRRRRAPRAGRPFESHNAWGLLLMASGEDVDWLASGPRWRLRQILGLNGLDGLAVRLGRRGESLFFRGHPGEIAHLLDDPDLVRSGISAAGLYQLEVVSGGEAEGYIRESRLKRFKKKHALITSGQAEANVRLRVVPDRAWHLSSASRVAPIAAVALDLAEAADARSRRAGNAQIKRLDQELRKADRRKSRRPGPRRKG